MTAPEILTAPESQCDHCKQRRTLFLYRVQHGHLGDSRWTCPWCNRKPPLLCTRCWGKEAEREDNDSTLNKEIALLAQICENNRRNAERNPR